MRSSDCSDDDLQKVIERPTDQHTREAYKALLNEVKDLRAVDDLARASAWIRKP